MKTCSQPDCQRTDILGRGLCGLHYQRFRYQGTIDDIAPGASAVCTVCGVSLSPDRDPRRIYCSRKCNEIARAERDRRARRREFMDCLQCGRDLASMRTDAKFCSVACGTAYRNAKVAVAVRANRKPCDHCGDPIPLHATRFCSRSCSLAHRRPEKYGLTRDELAALLAQHEVCAICQTDRWGRKGPQVDHDHATGAIRGVLCSRCNQGLGLFADDPIRMEVAAAYLRR